MSKEPKDNLTFKLMREASNIASENKHGTVQPFHLLMAVTKDPKAKIFLENLDFDFERLEKAMKEHANPAFKTYNTKSTYVAQETFGVCQSAERFANEISRPWAGYAEILFFLKNMGDDESIYVLDKLMNMNDSKWDDLVLHDDAQWTPHKKIVPRTSPEFQKAANDNGNIEVVLNAASKVKEKVFDQDEPIDAIHRAIKLARAGMQEKDSTYGNYLLAGPTGVGKSEVAKQFADVLGMKLVRIDMSEYMEKHTVSKLIGAPPGYVGHDAAGQLTGPIMEANKEGKDVLLLLDEVEKAHPAVFNVLLQVLDDARLTDSKGNVADFRKTLVLGTTNAGAREAAAQKEASKKPKMGFGVGLAETYNEEAAESITMKAIKEFFSPEFRNRLDGIFQFNELSDTAIRKIANKFIDEMNHLPAAEANNLTFGVTEDALEKLAVQGHDPEMGARPMKRLIKAEFREKVADLILEEGIRDLHLDIDYDADEEKFTIKRSPIDDNVQLLLAGPSNDGKPESTPPEGSIIDRHFG